MMENNNINKSNWEIAQQSERQWWKKLKGQMTLADIKKHQVSRAGDIERAIRSFCPDYDKLRLLQIGPGGGGEINFLSGTRYAIDPLAVFFKENYQELIDKKVDYIEGVTEDMPYNDEFFDIILFLNVIDHCLDPVKALSEIHRTLKTGGLLVFDVNVYNPFTSILHHLFYFIDKEHPHTFTKNGIRSILIKDYDILKETLNNLSFPSVMNPKWLLFILLRSLKLAPVQYTIIARKK